MGKMGGSKHLKREVAPQFWPIHRKESHWVVKPTPGPHSIDRCAPLAMVVQEMLGYAKTRREAKQIVAQGKVRVDGKVRRDSFFPVGLMDVISIPDIKKDFRVLPSEKGFTLHPLDKSEADFKLCRIEDKTTVNDGHVQLHLHDERTILIRAADPKNPEEDTYRTLDTLMIGLKDQSILENLKLNEGMLAILASGKNAGKSGKIVAVSESGRERKKWLVTIEDEKGKKYQTVLDYVFVIGDAKPRISLPKAEGD